jgi:hypothetical protein
LVIFGAIYRNLVQLRLNLAPVFGLGANGAFLVFFFVEVSNKGKPVPPPSRWLAAGRAIGAASPATVDRTRVIFGRKWLGACFALLCGKNVLKK